MLTAGARKPSILPANHTSQVGEAVLWPSSWKLYILAAHLPGISALLWPLSTADPVRVGSYYYFIRWVAVLSSHQVTYLFRGLFPRLLLSPLLGSTPPHMATLALFLAHEEAKHGIVIAPANPICIFAAAERPPGGTAERHVPRHNSRTQANSVEIPGPV